MPLLLRAHYSLCHLHLPGGARWVSWADVDATLPFGLLPTAAGQNPTGDRKEARVRMLSMCGLLHRWRGGTRVRCSLSYSSRVGHLLRRDVSSLVGLFRGAEM